MMITSNEYFRLTKIEAVCEQLRSDMNDVLEKAYSEAVTEQDAERAAELARKMRNKRLDASDKHCAFDKILPEAPTGSGFTDWIAWLKTLAGIAGNAWGTYRQALRDLPEQEGWPFGIKWPDEPGEQHSLIT